MDVTGWSGSSLQQALTTLDWYEAGTNQPALLADYRQHYGLPEPVSGCQHSMGLMAVAGFDLAVQVWRHPQPRGNLMLVHGYYDHVGLYGSVIRYCLEHGLNLVSFDLPGHGLSSGEPASIDSFEQYQQVFAAVYGAAQLALPGGWILAGQSTGGAIVATWLLLNRPDPVVGAPLGAVLFAPLLKPVGWRSGQLLHGVLRWFVRRLKRRFSGGGNNPDFSEFLQQRDPLQARHLSVRWVGALKQWIGLIESCAAFEFPVLLIQGDNDYTVDWRYNMPVYQRLLPQLELRMIAGGHHHLVNESPATQQYIYQLFEEWSEPLLEKYARRSRA